MSTLITLKRSSSGAKTGTFQYWDGETVPTGEKTFALTDGDELVNLSLADAEWAKREEKTYTASSAITGPADLADTDLIWLSPRLSGGMTMLDTSDAPVDANSDLLKSFTSKGAIAAAFTAQIDGTYTNYGIWKDFFGPEGTTGVRAAPGAFTVDDARKYYVNSIGGFEAGFFFMSMVERASGTGNQGLTSQFFDVFSYINDSSLQGIYLDPFAVKVWLAGVSAAHGYVTAPIASNAWHIVCAYIPAGGNMEDLKIRIDGTEQGSLTFSNGTTSLSNMAGACSLRFGNIAAGPHPENRFSDTFIGIKVPSLLHIQNLEGWLAAQHNLRSLLPADHIHKTEGPY